MYLQCPPPPHGMNSLMLYSNTISSVDSDLILEERLRNKSNISIHRNNLHSSPVQSILMRITLCILNFICLYHRCTSPILYESSALMDTLFWFSQTCLSRRITALLTFIGVLCPCYSCFLSRGVVRLGLTCSHIAVHMRSSKSYTPWSCWWYFITFPLPSCFKVRPPARRWY